MSDNLKLLAGNKLKKIIEKSTNTPIKGVLCGIFVTGLIQSSSGTTALSVGLVQAGLMTLPQAAGVIIGANIGTTVTSLLIGLDVGKYALIIIGLGAMGYTFVKNKKYHYLGGVVLGFGMLFFGLNTMGDGLKQIIEMEGSPIQPFFERLSGNPFLGIIIGTISTAIVQSSSATVGILQNLYGDGSILLTGALPILLGCNIGTTVTAVLASFGASKPAKRAAVIHVIFNFISSILFLILLWPYTQLIQWIEDTFLVKMGEHPMMTISVAHVVFNVVSAFIMFWFINWLVKIATKIIPGKQDDDVVKQLTNYSVSNPVLALEVIRTNIITMCNLAYQNFQDVSEYSKKENEKLLQIIVEREERIDLMDKLIHDYLIHIASMDMSENESFVLSKYLDMIRDVERIGDHCINISEFMKEHFDNNESLSEVGKEEIESMYAHINDMLVKAFDSFQTANVEEAKEVLEIEDQVDYLEEKYRKEHIKRLYEGKCKVSIADNFAEILSNIERMGDHCTNIALKTIKGKNYFDENEYHINITK